MKVTIRLCSALLGTLIAAYAQGADAQRPNIILVVLDDLDSTASEPYLKDYMPFVTTKTQEDGIKFTAAHSAAICCEARAAILTGLYAHNNGVFTNGGLWGGYAAFQAPRNGAGERLLDASGKPIQNEERTIARYLHDGGYTTGFYGKYLNGFELHDGKAPAPPPYWDRGSLYVDPGLRSYTGYHYDMLSWNGAATKLETFGFRPADYATDVLTDKALEFWQERANATPHQPKFLYLGYTAPHLPLPPAPRHLPEVLLHMPKLPLLAHTFQDGDDGFSDKPTWLKESLEERLDPSLNAWAKHDWANRLGSLKAVDEGLAKLWAHLEQTGEADDTLIFVTSDNGYNNGAHGLVHKMAPYESTLRVPLYVFGGKNSGLARGAIRQAWVSHVDYLPSFLELAALPIPPEVDGKSLKGLLEGRTEQHREEVFFSYQGGQFANGKEIPVDRLSWKIFRGIRGFLTDIPTHLGIKKILHTPEGDRAYKLIAWPKTDAALWSKAAWEDAEWELYDLDRDPFELHNLLAVPHEEFAGVLDALTEALERAYTCEGEVCHTPSVQEDHD